MAQYNDIPLRTNASKQQQMLQEQNSGMLETIPEKGMEDLRTAAAYAEALGLASKYYNPVYGDKADIVALDQAAYDKAIPKSLVDRLNAQREVNNAQRNVVENMMPVAPRNETFTPAVNPVREVLMNRQTVPYNLDEGLAGTLFMRAR
jgi:hypothetical protein